MISVYRHLNCEKVIETMNLGKKRKLTIRSISNFIIPEFIYILLHNNCAIKKDTRSKCYLCSEIENTQHFLLACKNV